jgi:hypothetical protein
MPHRYNDRKIAKEQFVKLAQVAILSEVFKLRKSSEIITWGYVAAFEEEHSSRVKALLVDVSKVVDALVPSTAAFGAGDVLEKIKKRVFLIPAAGGVEALSDSSASTSSDSDGTDSETELQNDKEDDNKDKDKAKSDDDKGGDKDSDKDEGLTPDAQGRNSNSMSNFEKLNILWISSGGSNARAHVRGELDVPLCQRNDRPFSIAEEGDNLLEAAAVLRLCKRCCAKLQQEVRDALEQEGVVF